MKDISKMRCKKDEKKCQMEENKRRFIKNIKIIRLKAFFMTQTMEENQQNLNIIEKR